MENGWPANGRPRERGHLLSGPEGSRGREGALVLRGKPWAYPWMIALLVAFIAYQLYRITAVHFSAGLTALTVFDVALVWLTWREYQSRRAREAGAGRR